MRLACLPLLGIFAAHLCDAAPPGQCGFAFTPISLEWCNQSSPTLHAINNSGVAVGSTNWCNPGARRAARWTEQEGVVLLPLPLGESVAIDINERGTIAGTGWPQGGGHPSQGWIYKDGVYTVIPKTGTAGQLVVTGLLEDDTVFGFTYHDDYPGLRAFLLRDGVFLPVPEALSSADCTPRGGSRGHSGHPGYIVGAIDAPPVYPSWSNTIAFRWDIVTGEVVTYVAPPPYFRAEGRACTPDGRIFGRCHVLAEIFGSVTNRYRTLEETPKRPLVLEPIPENDGIDFIEVTDQGFALGTSRCQGACNCDGTPCYPWWKKRAVLWRGGELVDLLAEAFEEVGLAVAVEGMAINDYGEMIVSSAAGVGCYLIRPLQPPGDVDFDCSVGMKDLMLVLENWGDRGDALVAASDLDRDGVIGPRDLAEVLGGWTSQE